MNRIRHAAVAGVFYPADPDSLRTQVLAFLDEGQGGQIEAPKAIIAPHAGYIYSGPIAGRAYAQIKSEADRIRRVIILAPAHRMAFRGVACSAASIFRTPLGDVAVDQAALDEISSLPGVKILDEAFEGEHSLEVHLPFLQLILNTFRIVPLLVGDMNPQGVSNILDRLWGGPETLIVISSDLSHYLEYDMARRMDLETSKAIERLDPDGISHHHACGRTPVNGLLLAAKKHQLHATTLDLRNSGDTAGPRNQVVGYGAYAFA